MRLSKVLLPVDWSMPNEGVVYYAKTLACRFHSDLTIAHVFELPDLITNTPGARVGPEWYEERRTETRRVLEEFHAEEFRNLPVRRVLLEGDPAAAIVHLAHSERMDLIVMPTHGYGRFRRFILGSVTAKVLHDADCPVLTGVHMEGTPAATPVFFRNIVCAADFDAAGENALKWAAGFAAEFQAKLTLVHALPDLEVDPAQHFDQALPEMLRQVAQENLGKLQNQAGTRADIVLEAGSVAPVVRRASIARKADLVVIGRHESPGVVGRLRANAYEIVRQAPCPVVSV